MGISNFSPYLELITFLIQLVSFSNKWKGKIYYIIQLSKIVEVDNGGDRSDLDSELNNR